MDVEAARRDIAEIREWMDHGRRVMVESWRHQVWWGVLSAVALVGTWWAVQQQAWWAAATVWPSALLLGWAGSLFLARAAPPRGCNRATRALEAVWKGTGGTLSLLGLFGAAGGGIAPSAVPGAIALVFGGTYFATAHISGIEWLRWIACAWWAGGVLLLVAPAGSASLLVLAGLVLLLEAGPGLVLSRQAGGAR